MTPTSLPDLSFVKQESFLDRDRAAHLLRSEGLNAHRFLSLQDICEKLGAWRRHYNE
jgi:hypothetical protein